LAIAIEGRIIFFSHPFPDLGARSVKGGNSTGEGLTYIEAWTGEET